ncbi:MAG: exo-alpha-sialidase [Spirochaetota bacterium]|nr:MAG: exo-alpha-sialidase [Spirochaetota bacterium]
MYRKTLVKVLAPLLIIFLSVMFFSGSCESIPEEVIWHGIKVIVEIMDGNPNDASIALCGSNVYISYCDFYKLNVAQSRDGGATFTIIPVDTTMGAAYTNAITALGSNIYVSHQSSEDGKLKFAKSLDGGETWSVYTGEIDPDYITNVRGTSVAAEDSSVFIGYYRSNTDLYRCILAYSADNGETWDISEIEVTEYSNGYPSIAVENGTVYVAYQQESGGTYSLKLAKGTKGAEDYTWEITEVDSSATNDFQYLALAVKDGVVFIAYNGMDNNMHVAKGTDPGGGYSFEISGPLDTAPFNYIWKDIAISGNNVYISYFTNDMKLIKSTDGGDTWPSENITFVDTDGDTGDNNAIAVQGDVVCLAYFNRDTYDLWFAKSIDNGETW